SSRLNQLEQLLLIHCRLNDHAVKEIAFSPQLPALRYLSLGRNALTDAGAVALTVATKRRLRLLDLGRNHVSSETAVEIADCDAMADLEELNLDDNHVGDEGALALASSKYLTRLRRLSVANNGLTEIGRAVLLSRFGRDRVLF